MKKTVIFSFIFLFQINSLFASFEYSGTFSSKRNQNEIQSYYVLLNKNDIVNFVIKNNEKITDEVFVKSIKLTSNENIIEKSEKGLKEFKVPESGIYELSVFTNASNEKEINYNLFVDKITSAISNNEKEAENINDSNEDSDKLSKTDNKDDFIEATSVASNSSANFNLNANNNEIEYPREEISKPTSIASNSDLYIKNIENDDNKESLIEKTVVVEPLISNNKEVLLKEENQKQESEPLIENDNQPIVNLNYNGELKLIKNITAYRFIGDKNKSWPKSVCFDNKDNIWVLDGQLCKVICFDMDGNEIISFGSKGKEKNNFGLPISLCVYKNYILVGDRQKKCIHIFNNKGEWKNAIYSDVNVGLRISNPVSISIRKDEIWIGDNGTNRVLCFDKNFAFLGSFGSTKESQINSIADICSSRDYIYLIEEEGIIKKYGTMGNLVSEINCNILFPSDFIIDYSNNIWVTNIDTNEAICFDDNGTEFYRISKEKIKELNEEIGNFSPSSISISKTGKIAISEVSSKQILVFELK